MSEKPKAVIYCRMASDEKPKAAIYCRVASADEFSIKKQEETLRNYAVRQQIDVGCTFSDNGKNGLTLDRPAFNEMMSGIKRGEINCVIITDFTRVSRNYILFDKWIKEMRESRVKVIAVNDNYDSYDNGTICDGIVGRFADVIEKMYKEEHSKKIKAGIARKKEEANTAK